MKFHPAAWIAAFVVPQHHQQHPTSTTKLTSRTSTVSTTTSTALSMVPIDIQQQQLLLPPTLLQYQTTTTTTTTAHDVVRPSFVLQDGIQHWLQDNIGVPPAVAASSTPSAPTREEITLLRQAFATFYGTDRDPVAAEPLLTKTIEAWQRQPPDESAGLYRVRGDCYMALFKVDEAIQDYTQAIKLLQGPGGEKADPAELPASFLGRARAVRSLHTKASKDLIDQGANDYEKALKLSSREEWDTDEELLEDGARTNPYATWEYGMALRLAGKYDKAQSIHTLASEYFDDIGDPARSAICAMDAGIDAASAVASNDSKSNYDDVKIMLKNAIQKIKKVEGRDIPLLQRVLAKEGETRMALASIYWITGEKSEAESQYTKTCQRLDQLEADALTRNNKVNPSSSSPSSSSQMNGPAERLKFNIDDGIGALDISCSRLKNKDFLSERLEWPVPLQEKAEKLYKLSR